MADAFDRFNGKDSAKGDAFDKFPVQEESTLKSLGRTALQIPQGVAEGTGPGIAAGLFQLLAMGESDLSPEEFHKLRELAEQEGGQFDDESYEQARQQMIGMIPTVHNIASEVEEKTGIPLTPQTRTQKGVRFATSLGKSLPKTGGPVAPHGTGLRFTNTALPRPVTALGVEGIREGLIEAGVPEPIADVSSLLAIKQMGPGSANLEVSSKKKPSGLTERRFESLEKPTEVSAKRIKKINEKVEGEFKDIAEDILAKSPIGETLSELKSNASFKQAASEGFDKVTKIAEEIPGTIPAKRVKDALQKRLDKREGTGFLASEYENEFNQFIKNSLKETKNIDVTPASLVKQYRKNNKGFRELKEPGKSYAYNQAKRDALREYNLAIEDVIKSEYGDSELSKIFDDVNKNWTKIMDAEVVDGFVNDLFDGKIQFKKGRDFFEKNGYQVPFKRALGEKGYKDFETLVNDLVSTEKAHKMLKVAENKGFTDLAKTGLSYLVHPTLAKAKFGFDVAKATVKGLYQMTLDKPQLAIKWDKGVKAMKKGDFKVAEQEFAALEKERLRQEALGKFNEKLRKES